MSEVVRYRTLGESLIEVGARTVGPDAAVTFAVLLYLGANAGRAFDRPALLSLFWAGVPDKQARHRLRQTLLKLRSLDTPLEERDGKVRLSAAAAQLDYMEVVQLEAPPDEAVIDRIAEFLPGYAPSAMAEFAEWVEEHRTFVHGELRRALLRWLDNRRSAGDYRAVEAIARKCLAFDSYNGEATLALAEAMALRGRKAEALDLLDHYMEEVGPRGGEILTRTRGLRKRIAERLPGAYSTRTDGEFVGRDSELRELTAAFLEARARRGRAVLVTGDAGIGKTRLVAEFGRVVAVQGGGVQRVACRESDLRRPLSMFVDLAPLLQAMPGALGCSPESLRYIKRLTEHDVSSRVQPGDAHEARQLYDRVREALFDLFDAVAGEVTVVVHVDDAHWLDPMSRRLLAELLSRTADKSVLVVMTARVERPELVRALRAFPGLVEVRLGALHSDPAGRLVQCLLQASGVSADAAFRDWCLGVAGGNPFYLQELVNHAAQAGANRSLPDSLRALVAGRLTPLSRRALRALQATALLGSHSTPTRLEAVLGYAPHELLDAIEELDAAALLTSSATSLQCRHDLVAEAACERLSETTRRLLHRRIGVALQQEVDATHTATLLWECARHWDAAGETRQAVALALSCGRYLLDVGLPLDAASVFERALASCTDPTTRVDVLRALAEARRGTAQWDEVVYALESCKRLRDSVPAPPSVQRDEFAALAEARWKAGADHEQLLRDAVARFADDDAPSTVRRAAAVLALAVADNTFHPEIAHSVYRSIHRLAPPLPDDSYQLIQAELIYHTRFGDLDLGVSAGRTLVEHFRRSGSTPAICQALRWASAPLLTAGLFDEAEANEREAFERATRKSLPSDAARAGEDLAFLHLVREDFSAAKAWIDRAKKWTGSYAYERDGLSVVAAQIHVLEGNFGAADDRINELEDPVWKTAAKAELLVLSVRTSVFLARDPARAAPLLPRLGDLLHRSRTMGQCDLAALAYFSGLRSIGLAPRAADELTDYLMYRRERFPAPRSLTSLVD